MSSRKRIKSKHRLPPHAIERRRQAKNEMLSNKAKKKRIERIIYVGCICIIALILVFLFYADHVRKTGPYHEEALVIKLVLKSNNYRYHSTIDCFSLNTGKIHHLIVGHKEILKYYYGDTLTVRFFDQWPYPHEIIAVKH